MHKVQKDILIKKLLYQSKNRGYKETELLLKKFTDNHLNQMSAQELEEFKIILEQSDADIYDWLCKKSSPPKNLSSQIMQKLIND